MGSKLSCPLLNWKESNEEKVSFFSRKSQLSFASLLNKNEVINAFKDANEVICKSSIVSIKNGYKFEENKEYFVSNGENIFNLKRCSLK